MPAELLTRAAEGTELPAGLLTRAAEDTELPAGLLTRAAEDTELPAGLLTRAAEDTELPAGLLTRAASSRQQTMSAGLYISHICSWYLVDMYYPRMLLVAGWDWLEGPPSGQTRTCRQFRVENEPQGYALVIATVV